MTTIEIVPLPGAPDAYRFALVIEHYGATELEIAQWARFGEECGAASVIVGKSPIVVIDRAHPTPALPVLPPVPPGPCPSIHGTGTIPAASLNTRLHDESIRWDRNDGGTDLLTDMGSAVNAYRYAKGLGPQSRIEVALPAAAYGELRILIAHRIGHPGLRRVSVSRWLDDRGVTLHLVYAEWTQPTQFLIYEQGSFATEPGGKIDLAPPLLENLSADVNDEPPGTFEAHIHVWENADGDNETGDLYRCTYIWAQGDRCDSLFHTNSMILMPPEGQLCRRVTRSDGTCKTETGGTYGHNWGAP